MGGRVVLCDKPSLVPILLYPVSIVIALFISLAIVTTFVKHNPVISSLYLFSALSIVGLAVLRTLCDLVDRELDTFALTPTHLVREHGLLKRSQATIPLDTIQEFYIYYAPTGRWFDFGNLVIKTPTQSIEIRGLPRPQAWERELGRQRAAGA